MKKLRDAAAQDCAKPLGVGFADVALYSGSVYTANPAQMMCEALAIKDGRFIYAGPDTGLKPLLGPRSELIDLKGKTVVPGFHDAHLHPILGALGLMECRLTGLTTLEEYLSKVGNWAEKHKNKEFIRGSGWLYKSFGHNGPNRSELDQVVPDRPVLLNAFDGHSAWVNSKALEIAGISADTPDPPGGRIERDISTGEPSGTLREWSAMRLVADRLPRSSNEELLRAVRIFMEMAARAGVTAVHDAMVQEEHLEVYSAMERRQELTLRVSTSLLCEPQSGVGGIFGLRAIREKYGGRLLRPHAVKLFIDGVVEGHTAFLLLPYEDTPGFTGEPLWDIEEYKRLIVMLDREGFQIHAHAVGDGAVRMALDGFEHALQINGFRDSRHQIAHLDLVSRQDICRFQSLGVISNFQPGWFYGEESSSNIYLDLLGRDRVAELYPMQSIFDAAGVITCGSDWPVDAGTISLNPLESIKIGLWGLAMKGRSGKPALSKKRVGLADMIDFYTRTAAYASFQENELGTIEPGKLADAVVLDRNIFRAPLEQIDQAKVVLTLFEGNAIYRDPAF